MSAYSVIKVLMIILAVFGLFANKIDDLKVIGNLFVGALEQRFLMRGGLISCYQGLQAPLESDNTLEEHR